MFHMYIFIYKQWKITSESHLQNHHILCKKHVLQIYWAVLAAITIKQSNSHSSLSLSTYIYLSNEDRAMIQDDNFWTGELFFSGWFRACEGLFILENALLYFLLEKKCKITQGQDFFFLI